MDLARDLLQVVHVFCGIYVSAALVFMVGRLTTRAIREAS